ncbi:MAG: ATPase, T2SS/T4P/T4SS family [Angelakisella sp.]|nr:ATPase, T2SS/T4P/T4SS family [Angelakisella sp.]
MVKIPLGLRLEETGIITKEQLSQALAYQKEKAQEGSQLRLGQAMVQLGFCTDEDIARAMSQITGYDLISLNNRQMDMTAVGLIPPELSKRYSAVAIAFEGDELLVAMLNPNDILAIDDLSLITGYKIRPVVVSDDELRAVVDQYSNLMTEVDSGEDELEELEELSGTSADTVDKPAVLLASQIVNSAIRSGASDIHIEPQEKNMRVRFRIDGVLHEIMQQPTRMHAPVVSRIKVMAGMDIAERRIPQDGRATVKVDGKVIDLRIASLPSAYGERVTMRLLNRSNSLITIDQLGFPDIDHKRYMETIHLPYGFLLVTGPTGSGKSTTLYASLANLNTPTKNVITLEDPIERRMDGINQVQMNQKAGMTFASGLRSILRSDPDIIMIGEIRDKETAKIAVESALTGHFVLSTLHTNDAASAVTRLGEMGVEAFLTASSLVGVVAQRLVRVLCPRCKQPYTISRQKLLELVPDFPLADDEEQVTLYEPHGCLSCSHTGYRGRRGVYEFLQVSEEIQQMILAKESNHAIKTMAMEQGMTTLRQDGFEKVRQGLTSLEELLRVVV